MELQENLGLANYWKVTCLDSDGNVKWEENKNSEFWLRENTENYSGEFLNDHYHGEGIFRWASGTRYEGEFFAGNKHGYGIFYYQTGNTRRQLWNFGDFVR